MATQFDALMEILNGQAKASSGDLSSLLDEIGRTLLSAQGAEQEAAGALGAARNAPPPQVDPLAQTALRAMGSASEMFTGQRGALADAKGLLADEQERLTTRRADSLKQLEDAYKSAAARAEKIGDMETSLKFKLKADKALQDQSELTKTRALLLEDKLASARAAQEQTQRSKSQQSLQQSELLWRGAQNDLDRMADERRAFITQGLDPNDPTGKTPLTAAKSQRVALAKMSGFLETPARSQQIEDMYNKSKSKGIGPFAGDTYDVKAIRTKRLEIPPDLGFALNPDAVMEEFMTARNPAKPSEYLYPRDRNGMLKSPWKESINRYMNRYFPGF